MSISGLKEICNKLIGTWYCDEWDEELTFHFNSDLFQTNGVLTVKNKDTNYKATDSFYGVGIYITSSPPIKDEFYLDIGKYNKRYFKIDNLTGGLLVLMEYWMDVNKPISDNTIIFKKKQPDITISENILQGLDLD